VSARLDPGHTTVWLADPTAPAAEREGNRTTAETLERLMESGRVKGLTSNPAGTVARGGNVADGPGGTVGGLGGTVGGTTGP
jgi:hypothetical protein